MGFNSQGAVQGGMSGAGTGASVGGGWGALIGGVLGAAGGSQLPQAGSGKLPNAPDLMGYSNPAAVSSQYGGVYVDPYSGRIVYTGAPGAGAGNYAQNAQMNSMLNSLLGIGGGGNDSFQLDQQIKQVQQQLDNMKTGSGSLADKYFGPLAQALLDPKTGKPLTLEQIRQQGFAVGTMGPLAASANKNWNPKTGAPSGVDTETTKNLKDGSVGVPNSLSNAPRNALWDQFVNDTGGKYGDSGNITDAWTRWLNDIYSQHIQPKIQEYNKALETDTGNQALRKEQQQGLENQLAQLTHAKEQIYGSGSGATGNGGQAGAGNPLLDYLTQAPNMQRNEIAKQLSDQQSLARQQASRMGMMNSSQSELAQGNNAINAGQAMNQNARQNWQDRMNMISWLQGNQTQQANQATQNAQTQLAFTGQGLGVGTHASDMEAQRQAAQAGYNSSYTMGQANLDSARQNAQMQAMNQGFGALAQGVGNYYGQQSGSNPQKIGTTESANNFGYKNMQ
jgi:hypothetical protein